MSEEHWCQACWMTKRTVHHQELSKWVCEECFEKIVGIAIDNLMQGGVIERSKQ